MVLHREHVMRGVTIAALAAGVASAARGESPAQPSANASDARSQDIVVTAQKREQTLITVPLSITALSGADLQKRGATTIEDVQGAVPGLSITEFSPGQQRVQLRGISVYSGLPTVGVYQDEMPLNLEANQSGQDVRFLDMKRVEVLRGPQGTLYGQGAVGGTLRYITNDVDLEHYTVSASGEASGVNSGGTDWKGEGVVNVPMVTDQLGARFAGSYQHFGGWIDNPILGDKNVNSGHALTLRGKLAMVFSDAFKLNVTGQYQDLRVGAQNLSTDQKQVFDQAPTPFSSKVAMINAVATYDFGSATLLSSTGYLHRKDSSVQDLTPTFLPILPLIGLPADGITSITAPSKTKYDVFTQEVRLSSDGDHRFNWTVGGFYRDSRNDLDLTSVVTPALFSGADLYQITGTTPSNSRSWATFGEASYHIIPTVTALVGLRYFQDRRYENTTSTVFGVAATDIARAKFHALTPRFNLSWQPNAQTNLYANVAKGFRSGGFNLSSLGPGIPLTYAPDSVWTYEIGGKFQTADRKLSLELAGYRNVWDNVQTTSNVAGLPTNYTSNGGKLTGWGADGSIAYSPIRPLTLTVTGGWNNMGYRSNSAEHFAGDQADYVPRFTGSASAEYRFDVAQMPSFLRVDYQYSDRFQVYLRNFQIAPVKSDKVKMLNARLGTSKGAWSAAVFARNLLNRDSVSYPAFGSLIYPSRLEPRTVGVSLSMNY